MSSLVARGLIAGLVTLVPVFASTPALAADELDVELPGGSPLLDLEDLYPGSAGSADMIVTNRSGGPATVVIKVVDLQEDDNGCNRPEKEAGDTTCGTGGGELGRDVNITLRDADTDEELWSGSLREMSDAVVLDAPLDGQSSRALTFEYVFVLASGNETQTDHVGFDLEVVLQGDTQVAGASVTRVAGAQLPRTGSPLLPISGIGVGMAAAGVAARVWGRHRKRSVEGAPAVRPG